MDALIQTVISLEEYIEFQIQLQVVLRKWTFTKSNMNDKIH